MSSGQTTAVQKNESGQTLGMYYLPYRLLRFKIFALVNKEGVARAYKFGEFNSADDYLTLRDPNHGYMLNVSTNRLADDQVRVAFDDAGYISKVYWQGTDRSLDVLEDIANAVIRLSSGVPGAFPPSTKPPPGSTDNRALVPAAEEPLEERFLSLALVDPTSERSIQDARRQLEPYGLSIDAFRGDGVAIAPQPPQPGSSEPPRSDPPSDDDNSYDGLLYRPALAYRVELKCTPVLPTVDSKLVWTDHSKPICNNSGGAKVTTEAFLVQAENASPIIALDFDRSLFVNRRTELAFKPICGAAGTLPTPFAKDGKGANAVDDPDGKGASSGANIVPAIDCVKAGGGSLQTVNYEKPSEAAAFFDWPLDIIDTILNLPIQKLRFLATGETEAKALVDAQKGLLDSQKALADSQKQAADARKAAAEAEKAAAEAAKAAKGASTPPPQMPPDQTAPPPNAANAPSLGSSAY